MAAPWGADAGTPSSHQLGPQSYVLEKLTWSSDAPDAGVRYVIVDGFAQAIAYCQRRLAWDLVAPAERDDEALARWRRARAVFAPGELERRWRAAEQALAALQAEAKEADDERATAALGERLRAISQQYALDLELGAIYALPADLAALLAAIGAPFVWWDDDIQSVEQERAPFDYADARHRAILARRLREQNETDETDGEAGDEAGVPA
ncbi:MAG: hypothetical protein ACRDID_08130 [Ktedonobacterales bacterium]